MCHGKRGLDTDSGSESDSVSDSDSDSDSELETEPLDKQEDDSDELVRAIKAAKESSGTRDRPPDVVSDEDVTVADICLHPARDVIAVANIDGDVALRSFGIAPGSCALLATHELHADACRDVEFDEDGLTLLSGSKDGGIVLLDVESGKMKAFRDRAHDAPITRVLSLGKDSYVSGDEEGTVRMWDARQRCPDPVFSLKIAGDYVSDVITNSASKFLVCASGDGSLSTINTHGRKIYVQTELYDSELTCLGLFKNDTKILVGSSTGKMYMFNWGEFGLHSDEFPCIKQSISCMIPVTDNVVVFSGEDGVLRALHLFPHKHLGVVGQHAIDVDKIDISHDGHYLASFSHDNDIKFWNVLYFEDVQVKMKKQNKKKDMTNNLPSSKMGNTSDFFAGMS